MTLQIINKAKTARALGISRSSLYYQPKREIIDNEVKSQVEAVLADNPAYGHKRIALALKLNKKRIRRIMKKFNIKPYRRKAKNYIKKDDVGKPPTIYKNCIEDMIANKQIIKPNQIWCTDFTYIKHQNRFIYFATIIDLYTREIVGTNISRFHNRFLVVGALEDALLKYSPPDIIHSDQGSEYDSAEFTQFVAIIGSQVSMSAKSSPWQNGHQESFFGHFKREAGDLNRFDSLGKLVEYIYQQIY